MISLKNFLQQKFIASVHKLLLFNGVLLLLYSCGTGSQDPASAPEGMSVVELSQYGKPFSIFVPDTSKNPLSITEESSGALILKAGNSFAVSIFEEAADLELKRSDITSDEINKLTAFLVEEPNALLWESAITEPQYHFVLNTQVAGRDFSFQDVQDPETKPYSKSTVQMMYDNCKKIVGITK